MEAIRPVPNSHRKVYFTRGRGAGGAPATYSPHGEAVTIVDSPDQANSIMTLFVGANPVLNRGQIRRLTKAAQADQRRELRGKKPKALFERSFGGASAQGSAMAEPRKRSSARNYLLAAAVLWIGLLIAYVAQTGKVGHFFAGLLLTPIVLPVWALMLAMFNSLLR